MTFTLEELIAACAKAAENHPQQAEGILRVLTAAVEYQRFNEIRKDEAAVKDLPWGHWTPGQAAYANPNSDVAKQITFCKRCKAWYPTQEGCKLCSGVVQEEFRCNHCGHYAHGSGICKAIVQSTYYPGDGAHAVPMADECKCDGRPYTPPNRNG